ncbi:replicative DNA helicase [Limnobaculum xujianqingii]|uniref:replicative DNA helicase n=1 Tax=Limnobaculum xujianqingii TaxID=2738837 RepID=UPI00112C0154|nr:replicative DNA helicase [Limnobaculum xujianqingii]
MRTQDLESSVIGSLLVGGASPDAFHVISTLPEEAFSIAQYREAYREIKRQALTNSLIDPIMVSDSLGGSSHAVLSETVKHCWSAANIRGYADLVRKAWSRRKITEIVRSSHQAIESARNSDETDNAVSELLTSLTAISSEDGAINPVKMTDLLENYLGDLECRNRGESTVQTLQFNMPALDEKTGGLNKTDLMILAARPAMGKAEYALTMARGVADRGGVLMFSMEMTSGQLTERNIAGTGGLSVSKLKNPKMLNDEDWARIASGIGCMDKKDFWMVDTTDLSVEQIRAIAESHKRQNPTLSAIFIDYLGLIKKPKAERNDLAIAHISRNLKFMAMQLKTPVIVLSQLSRDVESRPNKRPVSSDLRDSGSIEQDADVIAMLYRDEYYNESSPAKGIAEVIVTKNRNGETGTIYQEFRQGHFYETSQEHAQIASREKPEDTRRYSKKGAF